MQDRQLAIQQLLVDIYRLNECGQHRQAFIRACEAAADPENVQVPVYLRGGLLLAAARSSYYLSLFDKAQRYLAEFDHLEDYKNPVIGDSQCPRKEAEGGVEAKGKSIPAEMLFESLVIKSNVLRRLGLFSEAVGTLESIESVTLREVPTRLIIEKLLVHGCCLFRLGKVDDARERLEAAHGLAIHDGNIKARARILGMLGLVARSEGLMDKALDCFDKGREICRAHGDSYGEGVSLLNLAIAYYHGGRFKIAEKSALKARSLFEKCEWALGDCRAMILLGNISRALREYEKAERLYSLVTKIAMREGFAREEAMSTGLSGMVCLGRREFSKGRDLIRKGLKIADRIAPRGDLAVELRRRMGEAFLAEGRSDEAEKYLSEALKIAKESGDLLEEGLALRDISILEGDMNGPGASRPIFEEAVSKIRKAGGLYELARTHLLRAEEIIAFCRKDQVCLLDRVFEHPDLSFPMDVSIEWQGPLGESLKSLMEAGHLFSAMDDELLGSKTDKLIGKLLGIKRSFSGIRVSSESNGDIIYLRHLNENMVLGKMSGVSETLQEVARKIWSAAGFSAPVLITGETGTGKELVARLIHENSPRSDAPFVAVNCAAIPEHLFESEFFGHRKGCFTGAGVDRKGIFEEAHSGTVFLDEIGELSTLQQVKLLRVLQEKKIKRVGDNIERPVDIRIISATNRDLQKMIEDDSLREDFYYRINAEHIHIEPLRKRPEDIVPILSWRLLCAKDPTCGKVPIEALALSRLQNYSWPGNVRQLISVADRLAHISDGGIITLAMLPANINHSGGENGEFAARPTVAALVEDKRTKLKKVMNICQGNKSAAAKWLGISRGTLYKQLRQAGLGHLIR